MRLEEVKGRWCQPLGYPVFWRHHRKQILHRALVRTTSQGTQFGVGAGEERGQAARTPGSSALLRAGGCSLDDGLSAPGLTGDARAPCWGPCAFLDHSTHPSLGYVSSQTRKACWGLRHCRESPRDVWPSSITLGVGEPGSPGPLWVFSDEDLSLRAAHVLPLQSPRSADG